MGQIWEIKKYMSLIYFYISISLHLFICFTLLYFYSFSDDLLIKIFRYLFVHWWISHYSSSIVAMSTIFLRWCSNSHKLIHLLLVHLLWLFCQSGAWSSIDVCIAQSPLSEMWFPAGTPKDYNNKLIIPWAVHSRNMCHSIVLDRAYGRPHSNRFRP